MSDAYSISFRDGNFDPTRPARVLPTPQRWRGGYGLKNLGRGGNGYYLTRPTYIYKNAIRVFIFISTYIYKNAIRVTHIYILIFSGFLRVFLQFQDFISIYSNYSRSPRQFGFYLIIFSKEFSLYFYGGFQIFFLQIQGYYS